MIINSGQIYNFFNIKIFFLDFFLGFLKNNQNNENQQITIQKYIKKYYLDSSLATLFNIFYFFSSYKVNISLKSDKYNLNQSQITSEEDYTN